MLTKSYSVVSYCWSDTSSITCNNALFPRQIQFLLQLMLLASDPVSCELHIKLIVSVSFERKNWLPSVQLPSMKDSKKYIVRVIGIRPLAPIQNSVSLKLIQRKTLNFVTNLPDVENITK